METQPPPLETQAADRDRQFETQAPQAADREFDKVPVPPAPLATADTRQEPSRRPTGPRRSSRPPRRLFADDELAGLRARWDNVQAAFVDDPRECVHKADGLVSDVVEQLTS